MVGSRPDGSLVNVAIVDTGITYAHPVFRNAAGATRIDVLKDFTGEGRIYFTAAGRFDVAAPTKVPAGATAAEAIDLTADYLVAPSGNVESPDPSDLKALAQTTIVLGPQLYADLSAPGATGARFGVLSEVAFGTKTRSIDLNHNGTMNDLMFAILVPAHDGVPDTVWLDTKAKGDFRTSVPLTNFATAKATQTVFSERIGLEIADDVILDSAGTEVPVKTAALVGFDPGGHGTHVAGITAGRKMFANHPDNTEVRGVAPGARIQSGRICANTGGCRATEAIIDLAENGAEVINMSIGSLSANNDGYGVQEAIINRLTMQHGTLFVIAASNDGPGRQTVGSPSTSRLGMSVAATASPTIIQQQYLWPGTGKVPSSNPNAEDFLLYFSSRGPTAAGGLKPDISAPGTWLSAVPLNAAPGVVSGLDVKWGTSMASPAMAGAATLLLDAAKRYNVANAAAESPLAIDGRTLRRVLLASARPFDVTSLDVHTGHTRSGQYTFADEGFGMVNLHSAWTMLKAERQTRVASSVTYVEAGVARDVAIDWDVRVLRKNPNGLAFDGTRSVEGAGSALEPRLGRGLWIDASATDTLFKVQVTRRLPTNVVDRADIGELTTQLITTADELELETVIHGSHLPWVRPGGIGAIDCSGAAPPAGSPAPRMLVIGEGAADVPVNPTTGAGGSVGQSSSALIVCIDRTLVAALPPGDHGALIAAYRAIGGARERVPTFVVPVYVTVPHKTLAGQSGYHVTGVAESFAVSRNYVAVPTGTSIVKLTLTVPAPTVVGTTVSGCSGVSLEALEGGNLKTPPEFVADSSKAIAQSCTSSGKAAAAVWRTVSLTRAAPAAGIWDLHVFGLYQFSQSPYTLDVEFAKVVSTKTIIEGAPDLLSTTFDVNVLDASYPLLISSTLTKLTMSSFVQTLTSQVVASTKKRVPNAAGVIGREYGADLAKVTITTGGSVGNDLDLEILECDDAALTVCKRAASSGGPADDESAEFTPKPGKFYVAEVEGYSVKVGNGAFTLKEIQRTKTPESGTLTMTQPVATKFSFVSAFATTTSALLADARFTSRSHSLEGEIDVKDDVGTTILRIPLRATLPTP